MPLLPFPFPSRRFLASYPNESSESIADVTSQTSHRGLLEDKERMLKRGAAPKRRIVKHSVMAGGGLTASDPFRPLRPPPKSIRLEHAAKARADSSRVQIGHSLAYK